MSNEGQVAAVKISEYRTVSGFLTNWYRPTCIAHMAILRALVRALACARVSFSVQGKRACTRCMCHGGHHPVFLCGVHGRHSTTTAREGTDCLFWHRAPAEDGSRESMMGGIASPIDEEVNKLLLEVLLHVYLPSCL